MCVVLLGISAGRAPTLAAAPVKQRVVPIAYDADNSCPAFDGFAILVKAWLPEVDLVSVNGAERARSIQAATDGLMVSMRGSPVPIGTLSRDSERTRGARVIRASTCAEVAQALAVSTALALSEIPSTAMTAATAATPSPPSLATAVPRASWVLSGGLTVARLLELQDPMATASFAVARDRDWAKRSGFGVPDLQLEFAYSRSDVAASPLAARFHAWQIRAEVCPLGVSPQWMHRLTVRLCVTVEGGELYGEASRATVSSARIAHAAWGGFGGLAGLQFSLTSRWLIGATIAADRPVRAVRFVYDDPVTTVAVMPAVVWNVGAFLGVRFP